MRIPATHPTSAPLPPPGKPILFAAVIVLGISTMLAQLTLMREMLVTFAGNELLLGQMLGLWILLSGAGSALGRWADRWEDPLPPMVFGLTALAVLPLLDVALIPAHRALLPMSAGGASISVLLGGIGLLAPYCLVSGFLLTLACSIRPNAEGPISPLQVLSLNSFGCVIGGAMFAYFLIHTYEHVEILYLQSAFCLIAAWCLAWRMDRRTLLILVSVVLIALMRLVQNGILESFPEKRKASNQQWVTRKESPLGRISMLEQGGQYDLYENGAHLFSTNHRLQAASRIRQALSQRPNSKTVLLLGEGATGAANEALLLGARDVDCLETDPTVFLLASDYFPENLKDRRIHTFQIDGRRFLRWQRDKYEAVVFNVPFASTLQWNRFLTQECFSEAKRSMLPDGIFSLSVNGPMDASDRLRVSAILQRTLQSVFSQVSISPTESLSFLASDRPLEQPPSMAAVPSIEPAVAKASCNRDFSPSLFLRNQLLHPNQAILAICAFTGILLVGLGFSVRRPEHACFNLFVTGFLTSTLGISLLLGFQILYGSIYQQLGLLLTIFMAGLVLGTRLAKPRLARWTNHHLRFMQGGLGIYALLLPFALKAMGFAGRLDPPWMTVSRMGMGTLPLMLGMLIGMQFAFATKRAAEHASNCGCRSISTTAARLFMAGGTGAGFGAVLASTALIPLVGITTVCLSVGIACFCASLYGPKADSE